MAIELHKTQRILCSSDFLYDIVVDVAAYPTFLPWCQEAHILEEYPGGLTADLTIGYKAFKETYRSDVKLFPKERVTVTAQQGPLRHLRTDWSFKEEGPQSTLVTFDLHFSLNSTLLEMMLRGVFDASVKQVMQAFEQRALLFKKE